jgi:hypothetical protein
MAEPIAYGADWSARQIHGPALTAPVNDRRDGTGRWYRLSFTLRYADFPGQGHAVLTKEEYESHLAAGLRSMLIYQRTTRDPDGGEARGREFGHAAVAYAKKIGYGLGEPIFGCADAPIGSYNLDVAEAFFRGFAAVVRAAGYLAGGYGFRDVIYRLQDRGVVDVLWLCGAESGWRPGIAIYQWNNGRVWPAGVEADLVKQFEPIPGAQREKEEDMSGVFLRRGADTGRCFIVEFSTQVRAKWHIPNPEVLEVVSILTGLEAKNVPDWTLDYIGNSDGPPPIPVDIDEDALAAAVSDGVIPAVVRALQDLPTEGLSVEETVEAVREALRRGTGA